MQMCNYRAFSVLRFKKNPRRWTKYSPGGIEELSLSTKNSSPGRVEELNSRLLVYIIKNADLRDNVNLHKFNFK